MSYPYLSDVVRDFGISLPLPIPTFGLLVATAILVALSLLARELQRLHSEGRFVMPSASSSKSAAAAKKPNEQATEIAHSIGLVVVLVGLLGARVFHILEYPRDFIADPWGMIFTRSGFTIYGGMLFGALGGTFYLKKKKLPIAVVLDAVAPAVLLAYAIGRIGCQISGDGDWGIEANMMAKPTWLPMWLWAQTYTNNIAGIVIAAPGVYPAPIYETMMALVGFAILWRVRKHSFKPGWLAALFLVLYGIERFLVELIRVNSKMNLFGIDFTQAQALSVLFVVMGTICMTRLMTRPAINSSK